MKKIFSILFSFILLTSWVVLPSADQSEEASAKIKAIYIYNFTKYIEWPDNYKQGNFVIGVVGTNATLVNELNKMATSKTVGNQKLEIKNISGSEDASECHIVFILSDYSTQLSEILTKIKGKSVLVVTDKAGMAAKGSAINFVFVDNKQKIELNKTNVEKYRLKVASTLVDLALQVK